jgi:hypothetical protein
MSQTKTTLEEQVEAAFTYRGNVTINLTSGEQIEGFLFNREFAHAKLRQPPFVELFVAGSGQQRKIKLRELASVEITGENHAVEWTPPQT